MYLDCIKTHAFHRYFHTFKIERLTVKCHDVENSPYYSSHRNFRLNELLDSSICTQFRRICVKYSFMETIDTGHNCSLLN